MIFFTVTNTKKKRNILIKAVLITLMISFLMPYLNILFTDDPLQDQAVIDDETYNQPVAAQDEDLDNYPGEPVRVDGQLWLPLTYWQDIAAILSY